MGEKSHKYFSTGEFAKICGVKKQTLFHYDDIDLFKPEITTEKGYRYYAYQQVEMFNVIELLKELNMPLKEIKEFLHNKSPEETIELLEGKALEIVRKIRNLEGMRQMIEIKKQIIQSALEVSIEEITIKHMEKEMFVRSELILDCSDKTFLSEVTKFIHNCKEQSLYIGHPIGAIIQREQFVTGDYDNYSYLYTKVLTSASDNNLFEKPADLYAIGYHKGDSEQIYLSYKRILNKISEEKLQISNYSFEEYILDEVAVNGEENYVTKIMIQIKQ